jgi:uncharacterized membrane protein YkvA (DUF1232 family)
MARSKRRGAGTLRILNILPFLPLAGRAPVYARLLWSLASDPRVPTSRKALLALAAAYVASPIDLVPEEIPILGAIDDVAVVVIAIDAFLEGLPPEIVDEKLDQLGMTSTELERDLARVRRLVPKTVRQAVARVPDAIDGVSEFLSQLGLGRRVKIIESRTGGEPNNQGSAV